MKTAIIIACIFIFAVIIFKRERIKEIYHRTLWLLGRD